MISMVLKSPHPNHPKPTLCNQAPQALPRKQRQIRHPRRPIRCHVAQLYRVVRWMADQRVDAGATACQPVCGPRQPCVAFKVIAEWQRGPAIQWQEVAFVFGLGELLCHRVGFGAWQAAHGGDLFGGAATRQEGGELVVPR